MDWPRINALTGALLPRLLLPLILAVALALRLYGIGWDGGYGFHPDERSIYMRADCMFRVLAETPDYADCITGGGAPYKDYPDTEPGIPSFSAFFDNDRSPLNPHWFPLGTIILYLLVLLRSVIELFMDPHPLVHMAYAGRTVSALADVAGISLIYLLGKRIYGRRAALLAATLVALAVIHIQISHFYRPETILVFLLLASFWFMLQVIEKRRLRDSLLLGLAVGLVFAVKVSVLPLFLPLVLTYGFSLFTTPDGQSQAPSWVDRSRVMVHASAGAIVAGAIFIIITPYSMINVFDYVGWITREAEIAQTAGIVPYTKQYIDSTPFLYELKQTSVWGLGLPLGVVAWGGLLFTLVLSLFRVVRGALVPRGQILFLAWVVPNLLLLGLFDVKFLRYMFPVVPFMILMGSGMLFWFLTQARVLASSKLVASYVTIGIRTNLATYAPRVAIGVIAFVVVATGFYALAFERIYSRPHPAIQASRWINENLPPGTFLISDNHWDEWIPDTYRYRVYQVPIYDGDFPDKIESIADNLARAEYLVFYSNRTYGSVARIPEEYPLSSSYYQLLFSGKLGYELDQVFTSYPSLLGVSFVDDPLGRAGLEEPDSLKDFRPKGLSLNLGYADNDVITYDHPMVLLFKNEAKLPSPRIFDLVMREAATLGGDAPAGAVMSPERLAAQREGGTWSEIIDRDGWANKFPILVWLLLVELIYLAALPLATFLFRPLPDRGIVLARVLGILGVCYVVWMLASLGWMSFSRTSVFVAILAIAALSAMVLRARWLEFKKFLMANWRLLAIGEALFLVAFLSFVAIRWANPDLWHPFRGGEKPMDFAYLNAVLRSTYMPPYDPWFAGGYLNYYYWGQFIIATLIKGTGIVPAVAYNLAVPLLFALTVTGAYSLAYNVTAGLRRLGSAAGDSLSHKVDKGSDGGERPVSRVLSHRAREVPEETSTGEASSSLTVTPARQAGEEHGVAWGPVIAGLLAGLFVAVMGNLDGLVQLVEGAWKDVVRGEAFPAFDFWRSSRMLPNLEDVTPSALTFWLPEKFHPDMGFHITEFPFFSFLFADLHAHMIVIPFAMLAIGLALSLLVGIGQVGGRLWLAATTAALAVAVGSLWGINSWDYPTYLLLALFMIGIGVYLRPGRPGERLGLFLGVALGTGLLSFLAFLPFHNNYDPSSTGIEVSKWQTPLHNYLGIHGLFLFLSVSFLIYLSFSRFKGAGGRLAQSMLGGHLLRFWDAPAPVATAWGASLAWAMVAAALGAPIVIYLAAAGYWTAALLIMILALTLWVAQDILARRGPGAAYALFPLVLIGLALLMEIGVEFIRVKDDIGRMNTLFKYYLQAWVLFGIASAYVLWYLGSKGIFRPRGMSLGRGVWLSLLLVFVASSFIYTILGTRARLSDRFDTGNMTLNGADYMNTAVHWEEDRLITLRWDYEGIRWLQDNVKGSPVVLEAHNTQYRWSSRIADYTGLPTVLGWPWHQIQQRKPHDSAVQERISDVKEIYSTPSVTRALEMLKLYDVEYVVVGQLERAYYHPGALEKFDRLAREGMAEVVYENEGLKIYRGTW